MSTNLIVTIASLGIAAVAVVLGIWAYIQQRRMARRVETVVLQLESLSGEMYGFLEITRGAFSDETLRNNLPQLVNHLVNLLRGPGSFLRDLASERFRELVRLAGGAVAGNVRYSPRIGQ